MVEKNNYTQKTPIHLITEKDYSHNLDHEYVCREINKHGLVLKISYTEDLWLDMHHKVLLNRKTKEIIKFAWRYGRFPSHKQMSSGWLNFFKAINQDIVFTINKPGIYSLENKLFLSLLSLKGFNNLLRAVNNNPCIYDLIKFLPDSIIIKVNRVTKEVFCAQSIDTKGNITWMNYDLAKLPRSYVFKTADTSGSKGVRLVLNESNTKGQRYFWEFVELFPNISIFIISEFIRPKKRVVIDPISQNISPQDYIFKDHVYFASSLDSFKIIGFSAFARKDNYKVHGSQETVSVVQFHKKYENA